MTASPDWPSSLVDRFQPPPEFWSEDDLGLRSWQGHPWENVVCAVCGIGITSNGAFPGFVGPLDGGKWLSDAVVIGDHTREYEFVQKNRSYRSTDEDPRVYSMNNCGAPGSYYKGATVSIGQSPGPHHLLGPVYAADYDLENGGPDGENTVYFPMHRACFHIALRDEIWGRTASTPLRALHRVLRHRFQVRWEQKLLDQPPFPLEEWPITRRTVRNHYSGGFMFSGPDGNTWISFSGFQNIDGIEKGYYNITSALGTIDDLGEQALPSGHYLRHDPLAIPDLTKTLLANLKPRSRSRPTKSVSQFRKLLTTLPNELQYFIFGYVTETDDWPLQCTRLLGSRFWKAMFDKNHPCMSWLFDLDDDMIRRADPDLILDWELLFRKVQQGPNVVDCCEDRPDADYEIYRGVLEYVPPGLEGRRRLWKLVGEMYIGDRSTEWQFELERCPQRVWPANPRRLGEHQGKIVEIPKVPVYWGSNGEAFDEQTLQAL